MDEVWIFARAPAETDYPENDRRGEVSVVVLLIFISGFPVYTGLMGAGPVCRKAAGVHIYLKDCGKFADRLLTWSVRGFIG